MFKKNIKKFIKDFHSFSRGERNGIIIILFLILVSGVFRWVYPKFSKNQIINMPSVKNETTLNVSDSGKANPSKAATDTNFIEKLSKKNKGKIYKTIELNSADSVQLASLPGIGPVLSSRIIKYRKLLGGFQDIKQLLEVFGLKQEHLFQFSPFVKIDTAQVIKIPLNSADFKEINKHPYISFEQTKAIFRFRNRNIYLSNDLLLQQNIFDSTELKKLMPYLQF